MFRRTENNTNIFELRSHSCRKSWETSENLSRKEQLRNMVLNFECLKSSDPICCWYFLLWLGCNHGIMFLFLEEFITAVEAGLRACDCKGVLSLIFRWILFVMMIMAQLCMAWPSWWNMNHFFWKIHHCFFRLFAGWTLGGQHQASWKLGSGRSHMVDAKRGVECWRIKTTSSDPPCHESFWQELPDMAWGSNELYHCDWFWVITLDFRFIAMWLEMIFWRRYVKVNHSRLLQICWLWSNYIHWLSWMCVQFAGCSVSPFNFAWGSCWECWRRL